jgi:hypothetical protein
MRGIVGCGRGSVSSSRALKKTRCRNCWDLGPNLECAVGVVYGWRRLEMVYAIQGCLGANRAGDASASCGPEFRCSSLGTK